MFSARFCFGFNYGDGEYSEDDQSFEYKSEDDKSDEGYFKMNSASLKSLKDRTNVFNTGYVLWITKQYFLIDYFDWII